MEDDPRIASERPFLTGMEHFEKDPNYGEETWDSDSDSDYVFSQSDSESDSESSSGSLDSDERRELLLLDLQYLHAVRRGSGPIERNTQEKESDEEQELFEGVHVTLPPEGNTREDESEVLDDNIQAVFDQAIQGSTCNT